MSCKLDAWTSNSYSFTGPNVHSISVFLWKHWYVFKAPTTLKSEGEVTSLSGADKREVRDNRESTGRSQNIFSFLGFFVCSNLSNIHHI
jgi:hypothetical protein